MRQRHVAGLVRREREREAAEIRLHRIERTGLGINGDKTLIARALDPGFEPRQVANSFVLAAIEFLLMRGVETLRRQCLRRERDGAPLTSPLAGEVGRLRRPGEGKLLGARALTRLGPLGRATLSRNRRG